MFASILGFLLALARAVPALESLFRAVVRERDQERAREADNRLQRKNADVDAAIDRADAGPGETVTHREQIGFQKPGEPSA